jgi:hypothetical protein
MTTTAFIGGATGTGSTVFVSAANPLPVTLEASGGASTVIITGSPGSDGSGTITTGGTAQNLFTGATPTNGYAVYNPDPTNDLWINEGAAALANGSGSIRVSANGGAYETPPGYKPFHAVSIVGAVTAQKFTARQW